MDRVRRPLILLHKECYYPLQYSSCFSDAYELRFYNYREWKCALTRGIRVRARTSANEADETLYCYTHRIRVDAENAKDLACFEIWIIFKV